jgi:glycoside/pentoside/hexuronide:cation symporter, GPH family
MEKVLSYEKVKPKEKLGYGVGELAGSLVWQILMFFLPFFYTDVYGISAGVVGTMFLVVRLFDAINDPLMGVISDRTNTRWGKFRPYIFWGAFVYGIALVMMFTTPDYDQTGKIIYAYLTYGLMMVIYTVVMVPYNSLVGVISPRSEERTSVADYKFVFAYAAGMLVQALIIPLVNKLGSGDAARGYQSTMAVFAVIGVIGLIIAALVCRERVIPDSSQKSSISDDFKDLIRSRPWIILAFLCITTLVYVAIRSGDIMYYFKYYVSDAEHVGASFNLGKLPFWGDLIIEFNSPGAFMVTGTFFVLLGVLTTKYFSAIIGKRNLYIICMLVIVVSSALLMVPGPEDLAWMYILHIIFSFASGPTMPLLWSMLADAADYNEWKTGRRATGLTYSAATFSQKAGFSLGGAIAMWILSLFGYIEPGKAQETVQQTANAELGIKVSISLVPAAIALIGAILLFFYNLSDQKVKQIELELKERKESANN